MGRSSRCVVLALLVAASCAQERRDAGHDAAREASALDARVPDAAYSTDVRSSPDAVASDAPVSDVLVPPPPPTDAAVCSTGATQSCATTCGTTGSAACEAGAWSVCVPPSETCNLVDDDCNARCDDLLGCTIGVDRSRNPSTGQHFYTVNDGEATCCGLQLEQHDAFYLYAAPQPGLVALYRCRLGASAHLYTTDPACEGQAVEGVMGFVGTAAVCGSVPLYRLREPTRGDHLYTTSPVEVSAAEAGGYVSEGITGYVWPGECGGDGCTWSSPVHMRGSVTTAATGFPSTWYGYPIGPGTHTATRLQGSFTIVQTASLYSEELFIVQYLPSGACPSGILPPSTPEFGPPGAIGIANIIVKAPTAGTFTVPLDVTLPGGLPVSGCLLLGLNGGSVSASHTVTPSADVTVSFDSTPSAQSMIGAGGEFCFGQDWGCQGATTDNARSFAMVDPIDHDAHLVALYGDISDTTFDGTHSFGAPPTGAWTATNDFYVYHAADCAALGVHAGVAGPGDFRAHVPPGAVHLLSVPLSGHGIGVAEAPVFQALANVPVVAGDCLVTLWGVTAPGGFDNETQVSVLVAP